jgi:hypothetical protein
MSKPTVPEIAPLVKALYERNSVGCCLHIVLDEGNVGDDDVCLLLDLGPDSHEACVQLAEKLLLMSKTQRPKLNVTCRYIAGSRGVPVRSIRREGQSGAS